MLNLIYFIFLLSSLNIFAATNLRWADETTPSAQASSDSTFATSFNLKMDHTGTSNTSTTESDATTLYVPFYDKEMATLTPTEVTKLQAATMISPGTLIPNSDTGKGNIRISTSINFTPTVTNYIYVASKDSSGNMIIRTEKIIAANTYISSPQSINLVIDFSTICINDTNLGCKTNLNTINTSPVISNLYVFITEASKAVGSTYPVVSTEGIYLNVNLSTDMFSGVAITLNEVLKGDSRLFASWTGNNVSNIESVSACAKQINIGSFNGGTAASGCNLSERIDLKSTSYDGSRYVKPLVNNDRYCIQVYFSNKWQFASNLSTLKSGMPTDFNCKTPEPIEVLLKKQACFLLTAGFSGNHPTVQFFRFVRDHYLTQSVFGQIFIQTYYTLAPKAALTIFKSYFLSNLIQKTANLLSLLIHSLFYILLTLGSLIFILYLNFLYSKYKSKGAKQNGRT